MFIRVSRGQKANKTIASRVSRRRRFLEPRVDGGEERLSQTFPCSGKETTGGKRTQARWWITSGSWTEARRRNARVEGESSPRRRYCLRRIYSSCSNSRLHFFAYVRPVSGAGLETYFRGRVDLPPFRDPRKSLILSDGGATGVAARAREWPDTFLGV